MHTVNMQDWPRRDHFHFYKDFDHPHFSLCAQVDLNVFQPYVKSIDHPFTMAFVYLLTRAANVIPEFRYRIRGEQVVEHALVHPSMTVLAEHDLFTFCTMRYQSDFSAFAIEAQQRIADSKRNPCLQEEDPARDDLLYLTAVPWVSFTSFMHPMHMQPPDSIPRLAWGKMIKAGDRLTMPLGVQAHHALMDGVHVGRYYALVQAYLDQPENLLS